MEIAVHDRVAEMTQVEADEEDSEWASIPELNDSEKNTVRQLITTIREKSNSTDENDLKEAYESEGSLILFGPRSFPVLKEQLLRPSSSREDTRLFANLLSANASLEHIDEIIEILSTPVIAETNDYETLQSLTNILEILVANQRKVSELSQSFKDHLDMIATRLIQLIRSSGQEDRRRALLNALAMTGTYKSADYFETHPEVFHYCDKSTIDTYLNSDHATIVSMTGIKYAQDYYNKFIKDKRSRIPIETRPYKQLYKEELKVIEDSHTQAQDYSSGKTETDHKYQSWHSSSEGDHMVYELKYPIIPDKEFTTLSDMQINKLASGAVRLVNFVADRKIDTIFFLDKSARPAAYLFMKTWKNLLPGEPLPAIKFINIGRDDTFDYQNISNDDVSELINRYGDLHNHTICIADEYVATGGSLQRAKQVMDAVYKNKENKFFYTAVFDILPSWYGDQTRSGVTDHYSTSPVLLAARFKGNHLRARAIRNELNYIAKKIPQHISLINAPKGNFPPYIPESAVDIITSIND